MCLVLMGKAASGKDTVRNILAKKYDFHTIVTYTTRPIRPGEIQDVTYHYISKDEFLEKIEDDFFAEWKKHKVKDEDWYYGSAKEDLINSDDNSVIILTPEGVRDIKSNGINAAVIYLYANLSTIRKRLKVRNDSNDKMENRIQRDLKDFKDAEFLADKLVYNNEEMNIENVAESVVEQYRKVLEQ